jgi:hypothetical protein
VQSDAARRTGDDRNLAVQPSHIAPCRNRFQQYSRLSPTRQASLFHRDRPSLGATKSPDFGMLGHILDSLIT